jgi:hypothetical protein
MLMENYDPTDPPFTPDPFNRNLSKTKIEIQLEIYGIKKVDT